MREKVDLAIPENIFRAYDVRGTVGTQLTAAGACRVGTIFGNHIGTGKKVTIARDGRVHSKVLSDAVRAGVAASGNDIVDLGMVPIPIANYTTYAGPYDNGIYITASHNPAPDNGIRFRRKDGTGFTTENQEIRERFFSSEPEYPEYPLVGSITEIPSHKVVADYMEYIQPRISISKPLKIALDVGCGAASVAAPQFVRRIGCDVITVNGQLDGTFPGRPSEPKADNMPDLTAVMRSGSFDFGVGYDGDGDRCLFMDEKGNGIQVEKIAVLLARRMSRTRPKGRIVANVSCSMLLEDELSSFGWEVVRVRVGDVFVCEAMREHEAQMGIETSSHFFYPEGYIFDDPILVTARVAEVLSEIDTPLSELIAEMPNNPFIEKKFRVPDATKFNVIEQIGTDAAGRGEKVVDIDGVKVLRDDGWVLLRCSNTQPVIRLFGEARSPEALESLVSEFEGILQDTIEKVGDSQ